jgi:O-antigen ligase
MTSSIPSATPLLNAFRRHNSPAAKLEAADHGSFEAFLSFLACLIPISVCVYLVDNQPLFSIGDVEFTQPDVVAVVLVISVLARSLFKGFPPIRKPFFLSVLLFLIATLLSALNASDGIRAAAAVVQIMEFGLLAWCFSLIGSPKLFLTILYVNFAVFIIETLIATLQFAAGVAMPKGTFSEHQQFAFYTSYSAAMAFALLLATKERRFLHSVLLVVLLFGSLLGQERAPWLAFVVAGIVVVICTGENRKKFLLGFAATLTVAVVLVASIPQLRDVTISRFAETENDTEQSNSLLSRMALWGVAYQFFIEHPILGVGPKNFQTLIPHYLTFEEMMGSETLDPHNVWLGTLAETGVVGFATYLFFCVTIIKLGTRPLRLDISPVQRSLCLAYLAYHVFWFTMSYHYFSKGSGHIHFMMIGLMLGMGDRLSPNLNPIIAEA